MVTQNQASVITSYTIEKNGNVSALIGELNQMIRLPEAIDRVPNSFVPQCIKKKKKADKVCGGVMMTESSRFLAQA